MAHRKGTLDSVADDEFTPTCSFVQRSVIRHVLSGKNIFVTGPGGVGKSFMLRELQRIAETHGIQVCLTAFTGTAASQLGGTTTHAFLGMGLVSQHSIATLYTRLKRRPDLVDTFRTTDVLGIDEVSMQSAEFLTRLDSILKRARRNPAPFGGMTIVFSGDFAQLPPVQKQVAADKPMLFECYEWSEWAPWTVHMTTSFRQTDPAHFDALNDLRFGEVDPVKRFLTIKPAHAAIPDNTTVLFSHRHQVAQRNSAMLKRLTGAGAPLVRKPATCFLVDKNTHQKPRPVWASMKTPDVAHAFASIGRKTKKWGSASRPDYEALQTTHVVHGEADAVKRCPMAAAAFRQVRRDAGMDSPVHEFAKGARIMCTVNIDLASGLFNGACGTIIGFSESPVCRDDEMLGIGPTARYAKVLTLCNKAEELLAKGMVHPSGEDPVVRMDNGLTLIFPKIVYVSEQGGSYIKKQRGPSGKVVREKHEARYAFAMYPVHLAYALTVHKAQGHSVDDLTVNLDNAFAAGHLYVALSRARDLSRVVLLTARGGEDPFARIRHCNPKVKSFYACMAHDKIVSTDTVLTSYFEKNPLATTAFDPDGGDSELE